MMIIAFIPFHRIEPMIYWLRTNVKYGGWLPVSLDAYYKYLDDAYVLVRKQVVSKINKQKPLIIMVDESTDKLHRLALDVVVDQTGFPKPILLDIKEMDKVN